MYFLLNVYINKLIKLFSSSDLDNKILKTTALNYKIGKGDKSFSRTSYTHIKDN